MTGKDYYDEDVDDFSNEDDEFDDGTSAKLHYSSNGNKDGLLISQPSKLRIQNADYDDDEETYQGTVIDRRKMAEEEENENRNDSELEDFLQKHAQNGSSDSDSEEDKDDEDGSDDLEEKDTDDLMKDLEEEDALLLHSVKDNVGKLDSAKHVRNQKLLWERFLELQIFSRRLLGASNRLPTSKLNSDDEDSWVADTNKKLEMISSTVVDCVGSMLDIQSVVLKNNNEVRSHSKRRRNEDELWDSLSSNMSESIPFYSKSLTEWTRKTQINSMQAKKFKMVNQDIISQVDAVVGDPERVRRKAHALAGSNVVFGTKIDNSNDLDETVYDDNDFYQQLLKEYIDSGNSSVGIDAAKLTSMRRKKKKVNHRASKGRVIQYKVHPKLQNFMFPNPYPVTAIDRDELFRSIFGGNSTTSAN